MASSVIGLPSAEFLYSLLKQNLHSTLRDVDFEQFKLITLLILTAHNEILSRAPFDMLLQAQMFALLSNEFRFQVFWNTIVPNQRIIWMRMAGISSQKRVITDQDIRQIGSVNPYIRHHGVKAHEILHWRTFRAMWNHYGPEIQAQNAIASSSRAAPPNHPAANQSAKGKQPVKDILQPETRRGESSQISAKGKQPVKDNLQPETRRGESSQISAKGKQPVKDLPRPETKRGESSQISAKGKGRLNDTPQPEIRQDELTRILAKGKEYVDENLQSEILRGESSRTSTFQKTGDINLGKETAKVEQGATRAQLSAESKVISDDTELIDSLAAVLADGQKFTEDHHVDHLVMDGLIAKPLASEGSAKMRKKQERLLKYIKTTWKGAKEGNKELWEPMEKLSIIGNQVCSKGREICEEDSTEE